MAKFNPVKKFAKNINLTLDEFSKEYKVDVAELDFDIHKTTTYYQVGIEKEAKEITDANLEKVLSPKNLRSPKLLLHQTYDIMIKPKKKDKNYFLNFSFMANENKTKAMVVIKPDSILIPNSQTEAQIISQIRSKMAQMGLLVKLFDQKLHPNVRKMLILIKKEKSLNKEYKFVVAQSLDVIPPVDEELVLHYVKDEESKSYVDGVNSGDLIVEYIMPKKGEKGRSLKGAIIDDIEPKFTYGEIIIDEHFEEKIEKEKKLYYAKKDGYIEHEHNRFSIANSLQVANVSFKGTGSIKTEENQNVDLKIVDDDHTKDAIGGGVKVDVASLDVSGSVGGNAEVNAATIDVGAQTHKNSVLEATESANIKLHRGNLKAKYATIGILETGTIEAEIANIERTVGGEVRAKEVYVDEIVSNSIIIASNIIEIGYISGEANKIYIKPSMVGDREERTNILKKKIDEHQKEINESSIQHVKAIGLFKESSERIKSFKKKFVDAQKAGIKPPVHVTIKLKQFKQETQKIKEQSLKIDEMNKENALFVEELNKELDAVFHAKVILKKGSWNGKSEVIFVDPHDGKEYIYQPKGKEKCIYLVKKEDEISVKYDM